MAKFYRQFSWLAAAIGAIVSIIVYLDLRAAHEVVITDRFVDRLNAFSTTVSGELEQNLAVLEFSRSFFNASERVDAEAFSFFAEQAHNQYPHLRGLYWAPRVSAVEKESFEKQQQQRLPGYEIRSWNEPSSDASVRDVCFPLTYLSRSSINLAPGVDVSSAPEFVTLITSARIQGEAVLSGIYVNTEARDNAEGGVIYALIPVYTANNPELLEGFLLGVYDLSSLLADAYATHRVLDIKLAFLDPTTNAQTRELRVDRLNEDEQLATRDWSFERDLEVGGRDWIVQATPTEAYLQRQASNAPLVTLIICLVLTLLIANRMASLGIKTKEIQKLIDERTEELNRANQKLELLTLTDALTGVVNRRGFDQALESEWYRAIRDQTPLTLLIVDVDHFKFFNDNYGHLAGDECLKQVAEAISKVPQRLGDVVARYGGEEFGVILPNTESIEPTVAERCRQAIEALAIEHEYSPAAKIVTVSVGEAVMVPSHDKSPMDLIKQADEALYLAKKSGRNKVVRI